MALDTGVTTVIVGTIVSLVIGVVGQLYQRRLGVPEARAELAKATKDLMAILQAKVEAMEGCEGELEAAKSENRRLEKKVDDLERRLVENYSEFADYRRKHP